MGLLEDFYQQKKLFVLKKLQIFIMNPFKFSASSERRKRKSKWLLEDAIPNVRVGI